VVVAIIAVLVGIITAVVTNQINKAKYARADAELRQFEKAFYIARGKAGSIASTITGNWCSACVCRVPGFDWRNVSETHECYTNWVSALNAVQAAAGEEWIGIKSMLRDPWGSPYYFDETEGEVPPNCSPDYLGTAGADGIFETADDKFLVIPPGFCSL